MHAASSEVSATSRRTIREIALAFVLVTLVAAVLFRVDAIRSYYSAIVAALLLYVPHFLVRPADLADYGLRFRPLRRHLLLALIVGAVVFPLFGAGYLGWERLACSIDLLRPLAPGPCPAQGGSPQFAAKFPAAPFELALAQLLVVAIPEELFFRGYLQGRLSEIWPTGRRLFGVPLIPVVVSSALFALCHFAVQWNPSTLAVLFPGLLFGWMRARSGSILPGALFHAACNLYIELLYLSFFG